MPSLIRSHAVGIAAGLLAGCAHGTLIQVPVPALPLSLLATLLVTAALAGLMSSIIVPQDLQGEGAVLHIAVGKGLKAGLIAVIVAGSLLCFLARGDALNASSAIGERALKSRMWVCLLVSLAAILPGVVCGCVGGGLGGKLMALLPSTSEFPVARHTGLASWLGWLSRSTIALLSVGLLSPLTFIGRPPKVDPPPPVVVRPAPPAPPPAPPPFHFVASPEFVTAKLGQINVDQIKTMQDVDDQTPVSLTPDYSRMAFCDLSRQGPAVTVFDLDWFKPVVSFSLPARPNSKLAWSPDNKRLACVITTGMGETRLWVLDVVSGQAVEIPRPKNGDTPGGEYFWWSLYEIAFFPSDEEALVLDLNTLMLKPLTDSEFFKSLNQDTQKIWTKGPRPGLQHFGRWTLGIADVVVENTPAPRRQPDEPWKAKVRPQWAFVDARVTLTHLLPSLPVIEGMKCYCPRDASKLILLHGQQVDVAYMKLTQAPNWALEIEMPVAMESITDESARERISKNEICAFAYRPLVNPLTGRIVGPDHEHVTATLRLQAWQGTKAIFAITQMQTPPSADDVVATLHVWEAGVPVPWKPAQHPDWWTHAGSTVGAEIKENSTALQMARRLDVDVRDDAFVVVARSRSYPAPEKIPPKLTERPSPPEPTPVKGENAEVQSFLENHHRKASQGDVQGMVADYADLVDFLNKGKILKEQIAKEEYSHRELWPKGHELIQGEIKIEQSGEQWKATYSVDFRNEAKDGEWQSGVVDLEIKLMRFSSGLKIVSQKGEVHDLVKRTDEHQKEAKPIGPAETKAKGPSAVKIRLPGPVWVTTTAMRLGNQTVSIHEAVGLVEGKMVIHRTYRVMVDANTPKAIADKHPDGVISMQTAEIEGSVQFANGSEIVAYFGRQGWVQAADAKKGEWSTACEKHAAQAVGETTTFQIIGDDLVAYGTRFKLIKQAPRN